MAITYETVRSVSAYLYEKSLKKVPEDTKNAIKEALASERSEIGKEVLKQMLKSARAAEEKNWLMCSDSGIPVYFIKIGTNVSIEADIKDAITAGFEDLTNNMSPPLLPHITNPFTLERSYKGKDIPIISFDLLYNANFIEITCSPKGLGSGKWADLQVFSFPSIATIEKYILDCVLNSGSQPCPPIIVGVGIGGTFDHAAKMAKEAMLIPLGQKNEDAFLREMENRLLKAINQTGIGPMGTGGDTTALSIHINYSAGHGFVPVAVCLNCWPNRRLSARIYDNEVVEYFE